MIAEHDHTVRTVRVEAQGLSRQQELSWRSAVNNYFQQSFPKLLDEVLNKVFTGDDFVKIDQLTLQVQCSSFNFDNAFTDLLRAELLKHLQAIKRQTVSVATYDKMPMLKKESLHQHYLDGFIFFIKHGYYPWWVKANDDASLDAIKHMGNAKARLLPVLKEIGVLRRLIYCVREELFFTLMGIVTGKYVTELKTLQLQFTKIFITALVDSSVKIESKKLAPVVFRIIMASHINQGVIAVEVNQFTNQVVPVVTFLRKFGNKNVQEQELINGIESVLAFSSTSKRTEFISELPEVESESIWIDNAGIVILHPFLVTLFKRLEITGDTGQMTDLAKAMQVLFYLIYGDVEVNEALLPLCKIICGLDVYEAVPLLNDLSESDLCECDDLLLSVIDHWSALKSTSPAGLRNTFFFRNAKLVQCENGWELLVEPKTEDILLEKLPWAISYIKLPWMKTMLHTIWHY